MTFQEEIIASVSSLQATVADLVAKQNTPPTPPEPPKTPPLGKDEISPDVQDYLDRKYPKQK